MKLFNLRLTTLKSKLYAIVFASFVVRVVAFFVLPNTPSALGPDEGNYGALTEWIAQGKPADAYPYTTLYIISKSLIIPAAVLNHIGLNGLDSVRIISSLYGLFTLALAAYLVLHFNNTREEVSNFISKNQTLLLTLMAIFAFLPSHLLWSVLGLRESALEFWVIAVFTIIYYSIETKKAHLKFALVGVLICILLVFSSRPQVGWVLGIALLVYFSLRVKLRVARLLFLSVLIAIILGSTATTPTNNLSTQIINPATEVIRHVDTISISSNLNKVGAKSVIKTLSCPISNESRFNEFFCVIYRAPYTTFIFLFRPMLGADVTSISSLFAAIENVFWLGAFLFVVVTLVRNRRLAFFGTLAPSLLFFSIYSLAAGAYEGNMGTAFRHKSLILWVVLLLIASTIVATHQRKAEQQGISGSSQE